MNPEGALPAGMSSEPEVFVWKAEGQPIEVALAFDVIDRMTPEIGDAFRALRKRGAEVGGVLLGRVLQGHNTTVNIVDYVPVPCEHRFGPSYTLSESDYALLDKECSKWRGSMGGNLTLIGFYRSNTREHIALSDADMQLLATRFPEPYAVALLVKPYAERAFDAAFYVRKDHGFTAGGQQAFPYRRKDLGGGVSPLFTPQPGLVEPPEKASARNRMLGENLEAVQDAPATVTPPPGRHLPVTISQRAETDSPTARAAAQSPMGLASTETAPYEIDPYPQTPPVPVRGGVAPWAAALLSILFAAGGAIGGYLVAGSRAETESAVPTAAMHKLGLKAAVEDDVVVLSWETSAPGLRDALKGLVTIEDGDNSRTVDLEAGDLARGRMRFRPLTKKVDIRMDVLTGERSGVTESLTFNIP